MLSYEFPLSLGIPQLYFSTGITSLDEVLGGEGYPRRRITEISGMESSGKTSVALLACASAQRVGMTVAYVDAEHTLTREHAELMGVDVDALITLRSDSAEQTFDALRTLMIEGGVDLVVIDSLPALLPQGEREMPIGYAYNPSITGVLNTGLCRMLEDMMNTGATCIVVNQLRHYTNDAGKTCYHLLLNDVMPTLADVRLVVSHICWPEIKIEVKRHDIAPDLVNGITEVALL